MVKILKRLSLLVVLCVSLFVAILNVASASEDSNRRLQISLSIFPRIVAVDNDIKLKLTSKSRVLLAFLYKYDKAKTQILADNLRRSIQNIAGLNYIIAVVKVSGQLETQSVVPSAIFLAERLADEQFIALMEYAIVKHIIVFSPFSGDVERGATVGIAITSRVKPYFNIRTLEQSSININALLMKMSKRYE